MTESSTTSKIQYSGDGVTTAFGTGFKFAVDADVTVILTSAAGVETTWTRGTQYTQVGAGLDVNGTVTVTATPTDYTPASGTTIKRVPDFTQLTDLPLGGALQSSNIESALDRNVHMIQSLAESVDRSLKLAETSPESASSMPDVTGNTAKYLQVNAAADGYDLVDLVSVGVFSTPISIANGGTASTTAGAARSALTADPDDLSQDDDMILAIQVFGG